MAGERNIKVRITGDSSGLDQAATSSERAVSRWSDGVSKAGMAAAAAAAAAGAAIAAALAAAVSAGLEQSKIQSTLAAQLGATGPEAAKYGEAAGDLYSRGVVGSFQEAADAVKAVFQNDLIPKNAGKAELDAITARVSNTATVLGEDANRVSAAVSQMLRTGVAKNATEAFDILNKGAQLGTNKAEDLLDTYNEYGTQFRKLGVDGPQSLGLINQAIKAGARDSDIAADALKEFSLRAVDVGNPDTIAGFKALGLSAGSIGDQIGKGGKSANAALDKTLDRLRNVKDPVEQAAIATKLFGTQAEDLGDALFAMNPSEAAAGLGKLGGAADAAGKTLEQSAGVKVDAFRRKVEQGLIGALGEAVGWIERNQTAAGIIAGTLATLAVVVGTVAAAVKAYTIIQAALNIVLTANPIGLVVVGIGILIGIIALVATKTKFFQTIWKASWGAIKTAAKAVGDWFKNTLWPAIRQVFDWLGQKAQQVRNHISAQWNSLRSAGSALASAYRAVMSNIRAALQSLSDKARSVVDYLRGRFNAFVSFFRNLPSRISGAASGMFNGLRNAFRSAINYIISGWNNLSFSLPSIDTPFGKIGGTTLNTPNLPRLASGGWMQPGKTYLTGERGPEIVTATRGGYVNNASDTKSMLGGGGQTIQVFIGDRELTDIVDVRIVDSDRAKKRRAGAYSGTGAGAWQ